MLVPFPARAADYAWRGDGVGNAWNNPSNYDPYGTPASGDRIIFDATTAETLVLDATFPDGIIFVANGLDERINIQSSSSLNLSGTPLIDCSGAAASGSLYIYFRITLSGDSTLVGCPSGTLPIGREVDNNGNLLTIDSGQVAFFAGLTGTGGLTINGGMTRFANFSASHSGTTTINNGAVLQLLINNMLPDTGSVVVNSGGTLDLNDKDETIGTLSGGGSVTTLTTGGGTLTVGEGGGSSTFSGVIRKKIGGLTKTGAGTFTLSGNNTYTGTTSIDSGTLTVNGTMASTSYTVAAGATLGLGAAERLSNSSSMVVASGATFDLNGFDETIASLSGAGTVSTGAGTLTINTALNPGTSPAAITLGNVDLSSATLNVEIDGTVAGTGYDQIIANGAVTLGGTLNLTSSISPAAGTTFIIINNTAGAVAGTFAGFAEGSTITAGGAKYKISYAGGDGDDVTLTVPSSGGGGGGGTTPEPEPEPEPTPDPRPAPQVTQGDSPSPTGSMDGNALSWPKVGGTNHYNVYRAACPTCPKEQVGRVPGTSFTDETALPGQVYYYFIRSDNGALSDYSDWIPAWRYEQNPGRAGDFNGDGVMDLLWWDPDTNQLSIWYMNGGAVQSVNTVGDGLDISQWLLVNTGDFNSDGIWDLLWWNPESGAAAIWYMSATASASGGMGIQDTNEAGDITGNVTLSYPGDLNGDGRVDLVWRDYSTGDVTVWLMGDDGKPTLNGPPTLAEVVSDDGRPSANGSLEWTLRRLYDMNADAKADLVWQHASDGRVVVWHMDGSQATGYGQYQRSEADNWRIAGLGDLNMDGRRDIVWRNDSSGAVQAWLMTGGDPAYEQRDLAMGDEALNWQVKAVGDFCSPGCDDVYCKNSDSEATKIVTLDGREFTPTVE